MIGKAKARVSNKHAAALYHIATLGVVLIGFSLPNYAVRSKDEPEIIDPLKPEILWSGSPELNEKYLALESLLGSTPQVDAIAGDCGPAKPDHAPTGCGIQQWLGYSETNPAAVAWLAIANTGTETCRVTITRLELSYLTDQNGSTTRVPLSSSINGVQVLSDGTDGNYWGAYLYDFARGSTFDIPADTHSYVHPFGPRVAVPEDATELTVRYAAEMTDGCVVAGGLDTYEEDADPTTEAPYTQNGSITDFIKEAYKSPWVTETIDPREPVTFSIERKPWSEREGWYKEGGE